VGRRLQVIYAPTHTIAGPAETGMNTDGQDEMDESRDIEPLPRPNSAEMK